ncbi:DUF6314 family protein [Acidimangrovimonas sediminis]|uniref:DUF6314 family protein n=1 Tax=Acidimangrovimonas sediminis TaxID=2056283 RepID=UPI0038BACF49
MAEFEGVWRIDRSIEDRLAGQAGRFEGRAVLAPDGPGALVYDEEGRLTLGNAPAMVATRRYFWRAEAGRIALSFADGRPFHTFDPGETAPAAFHDCAPDAYAVRYDFSDWPVWRAVWEVRGPRKDYRMESLYLRA